MFENREEAGRLLSQKLKQFTRKRNVLIVGITRGGALVAKTISSLLHIPLDILVIKKIGDPQNPELGIGAVGPKNSVYWDKELVSGLKISKSLKKEELRKKKQEREKLEKLLRQKRRALSLFGKKIILVDDGVATGATVLAAYKFLKREKAASVVLATPVISKDTFSSIKKYFDLVVALEVVRQFHAVGQFYLDFPQVSDEEIMVL